MADVLSTICTTYVGWSRYYCARFCNECDHMASAPPGKCKSASQGHRRADTVRGQSRTHLTHSHLPLITAPAQWYTLSHIHTDRPDRQVSQTLRQVTYTGPTQTGPTHTNRSHPHMSPTQVLQHTDHTYRSHTHRSHTQVTHRGHTHRSHTQRSYNTQVTGHTQVTHKEITGHTQVRQHTGHTHTQVIQHTGHTHRNHRSHTGHT